MKNSPEVELDRPDPDYLYATVCDKEELVKRCEKAGYETVGYTYPAGIRTRIMRISKKLVEKQKKGNKSDRKAKK